MKIKFSASYIPAFLSILLLSQEGHDWAHVIAARMICGCWGIKAFDNWTVCTSCLASVKQQVLIWIAGPAATYLIIWLGWWMMRRKNSATQKAFGFSLVFAAIPFVRILAALAGGSDETYALRLLFQHTDGSNRHIVALSGLLFILLMTIPALLRAFLLLPGWKERLFLFPVFLILPMYIERWILGAMNFLYSKGILANTVLPGTPLLIVLWTIFLLIIFAITYKSLFNFLQPSIQNRRSFKAQ
jgi:hypothetical protein